jgi:hypothetical protein
MRWRGRAALLGQTVVVLACSWLVWVNMVEQRLRMDSLAAVLADALACVLIVWAFSVLAVVCVYLVVFKEHPGEAVSRLIWSSAPAMWLAPAVILMSTLSPGPVFVGLMLLINVTSVLVLRWTRLRPIRAAGPLFRSSLPALVSALAMQIGLVLLWWDHRLFAAALFLAASATLTALCIVTGAYEPKKDPVLPPSPIGLAATFVLALALTATGIEVRGGSGGEGSSGGGSLVTKLYTPDDPRALREGGFPGVVLRTRQKPKKDLIVPASLLEARTEAVFARPRRIPFTGEYWLYRASQAPLFQAPPHALVEWGSPLQLSFHTADSRPLRMEARQKLDPPLDLSCCSGIQLLMTAGSEPGPLLSDLMVIDSTKPAFSAGRTTYLGTVPVGPDPSVVS